jgi:4'-phosphopantetheinyl transferase
VRLVDLAAGDDLVSAAAASLSPAEARRADVGTLEVRRRRVLLRAALRELLADNLGVPPAEVPLAEHPGRPALVPSPATRRLDFNASASGNVGLVAVVRRGRIGVDVQRIGDEDADDAVAEGWLAETERRRIVALPAEDRPAALTRAWTQKEAVLKGDGVGLWADLARVVTPVADTGRVHGWTLIPVRVPPGFVAALALRRPTPGSALLDRVTRVHHSGSA